MTCECDDALKGVTDYDQSRLGSGGVNMSVRTDDWMKPIWMVTEGR